MEVHKYCDWSIRRNVLQSSVSLFYKEVIKTRKYSIRKAGLLAKIWNQEPTVYETGMMFDNSWNTPTNMWKDTQTLLLFYIDNEKYNPLSWLAFSGHVNYSV
jgi:hypothetical protein